ncbi:MAG: CvpA family protein [Oscillospiraceae bacterium]|nr:CvpA family protein [Oscillospiraceae bacterium]
MTQLAWIIDLALAAVLLVSFLLGQRKGLILSLCGLATYFVALFGARFFSQQLSPLVADAMTPHITTWVQEHAGGFLNGTLDSFMNANAAGDSPLFRALQSLGLLDSVRDTLSQQAIQSVTDAAGILAHSIAEVVASVLIFIVAFLLILLVWHLLSRLLNQLFRNLPIVRGLNRLLGGVFGLCQGLVILFLIAWILQLFGETIPADTVEASTILKFFMTSNPISTFTGI